jgi:AcrR family transcriptional regulator
MSVKGSGSRRSDNASETRAALMTAARELFTEKGYAGTGTEEIVARARVTRGALYHHFSNKQDLFRAVVDKLVGENLQRIVGEAMIGEVDHGIDIWEQFRRGFQLYLDACLEPSFQRIVVMDAPAVLGGELTRSEQAAFIQERGWLERAMEEGSVVTAPVDALSALVQGLILSASRYVAQSSKPESARVEMGQALDALLRSLGTTRPAPAKARKKTSR